MEKTASQSYEIAYLLNPNLEEGTVITVAGNITKIIEKAGGMVQFVAEPKKRKLSYSILKHVNAYFTYTTAVLLSSQIVAIKKSLAEEKDVLRFLIVHAQKPELQEKARAYLARPSFRREREVAPLLSERPRQHNAGEASKEKMDVEEIDKKLEEILSTPK